MAIANAHAQCQAAFETLLESSNIDLIASGVNLEEINELFGKYKLWAGNVGATHYGKRYEISLDYRLREATLVKDQVLQVLATLLEKVTSATSLVQGLRAPFEKRRLELEEDRTSLNSSSETASIDRGAPNEEEDESDSPWDISSNSSGTSEHSSQKQQISRLANVENPASAYALSNTADESISSPYRLGMVLEKEMPQLMKSITLAITALYRMPIRKAAPFDRLKNKELLDFSSYQHFDVMYVKDKFPALDAGVATRLGKSITKRRQIIYYRSTHAMNIDASNEKAPTILSPRPASKMSEMMADSELQPAVAPPSVGASSKFTLRSKATTFKAGQYLLPDLQDDVGPMTLYPPSEAESRVSAVSSYAGKDLEVDIPSRPKGEDGKELELFECPYCMLTKNITSHSKWKKHVLEDLQPYMCTYESCQLGDHIFTSKNEWNQHEALYHRVKWFCNTGRHPEYEKQNDFIVHMKQDHQTVLNEARLATSGDIFRQPSRSNEGTCNLCLRHSTKVKGHVARHMEQISVFALPRLNRASGSVEAERRSQSSRRLRDEEQSFSDEEDVSVRSSASNPIDFNEPWMISETTKRQSDLYFTQSDIDKVGYITTSQALEVVREKIDPQLSKESCLQVLELAMLSGVDTLDRVEFAIALHLFLEQQKHPDQQIPTTLPQNLIPSNLRQQFSQSKEPDLNEETFSDHAMVPDADVQDWDEITNKFVDARQGDAEAPPADFNSREVSEFKLGEDWAVHYGIRKEDMVDRSKNEVERQNLIHEFADGEYYHLQALGILLKLYRNGLRDAEPPVILPRKLGAFDERVFGKVNAVEEVDAKLLRELRRRQQEQGPWVIGISDLIREFVRYARKAYFEYAAAFPQAVHAMRREINRNALFRAFVDNCRAERASQRLTWDHYLKQPITRIQRRCLILDTILKRSKDEEKRNLVVAIDELKAMVTECDGYLSEAQRKINLMDLHDRIKLRPEMANTDLRLDESGRELIYRGDLLRNSTKRFSLLETAAFLFDHYLVLTKPVRSKNDDGTVLNELFDVSRLPIPMDLLRLDNTSMAPVIRSGIRGGTKLATPADDKGSLLFPFTFRHVGYADYTLFASSEQTREEWAEKIIDALRKHASKLSAQMAEPYFIRVISYAHFRDSLEYGSNTSARITGTPLDRALSLHRAIRDARPTKWVTAPQVNCATSIKNGDCILIGTYNGIYLSRMSGSDEWQLLASLPKVTHMSFLYEAHILLVVSDQTLFAYEVDLEIGVAGGNILSHIVVLNPIPQRVSGTNKVLCFTTAKLQDKDLVIYAIRESWRSTVFKVLQPSTPTKNKKKSFLNLGRTTVEEVYFREYDEFYLQDEPHKIITFEPSIAVITSKDFEVLTLGKKKPVKIPDFNNALGKNFAHFAKQSQNQRRLNMFRLKNEFLLCYEEGAIFIDLHGDISRSGPMNFCGRAESATMERGYLILFHEDFVEIRNVEDEKLKQIIKGRGIRCVEENSKGEGTLKFVMLDPENPNMQLFLELILPGDS